MTLWFVVGTAAELIKIYPLMENAEAKKLPWCILLTGQSAQNFWNQAKDFNLRQEKIFNLLSTQKDLRTSIDALSWFFRALWAATFRIKKTLSKKGQFIDQEKDLLFVHGDTLSTVIGAIAGKFLGLKIVHVEAGMRSHNIWSPFPEEISRMFVSRAANFHMAPDENAKNNLLKEGITKGVIATGGNTVVDSLQLALDKSPIVQEPYVLVNIHRFENLHSKERLKKIVEIIISVAHQKRLIFVLMPPTAEWLRNDQDSRKALEDAGVELVPRLPFREFAHMLHGASFLISDGGSNQQECHYIGKPCLILRDVTESIEGIGGACVLSKFDEKIIQDFLSRPEAFERAPAFPLRRPTDIIFEYLKI